jgi:hypothetical protein
MVKLMSDLAWSPTWIPANKGVKLPGPAMPGGAFARPAPLRPAVCPSRWADAMRPYLNERHVSSYFLMALLPLLASIGVAQEKRLSLAQAEELILNIPEAISIKARSGCPKSERLWVNDQQANVFFQLRDPCDKSDAASNLIGNYTVDLKNGEIWYGVDREDDGSNVIDSPRLRELRRKFLG